MQNFLLKAFEKHPANKNFVENRILTSIIKKHFPLSKQLHKAKLDYENWKTLWPKNLSLQAALYICVSSNRR